MNSSAPSTSTPNPESPTAELQAYDTGADRFADRRGRQFLIYVVLPIVLFCGTAWYLLLGRPADQQTGLLGQPLVTRTATHNPLVPVTVQPTRVVDPGSILGGQVTYNNTPQLAAMQPPNRAMATPDLSEPVKCWARQDTTGVYTATTVLELSLLLVDGYTRANGGMIHHAKLGWFALADFGCAPGLERLEVEFVPPRSPTPRPSPRPATPTAIPVLPSATPTLSRGIVLFDLTDCSKVRWLVWGVERVYLTVGSNRQGVPGDERGQPVVRDLCLNVGQKIRLDAFVGNYQYTREGEIR